MYSSEKMAREEKDPAVPRYLEPHSRGGEVRERDTCTLALNSPGATNEFCVWGKEGGR